MNPDLSHFSDVSIGQYNKFGDEVRFIPFKGGAVGPVVIGDCNVIHEGVRILVGPGGFKMGDYNVVHNHTTIGGPGPFVMGHNCWIGQESYLDCSGGLTLGNGVTVGVRSCIWTHIGRGEQIEGWLCAFRPTVLEDDVWLVGDNVHVASGVTMGARSVAMAHSVVTRDTELDRVYAGVPAKTVNFRLRRDLNPEAKWEKMWSWAKEFGRQNHLAVMADPYSPIVISDGWKVGLVVSREIIVPFDELAADKRVTYFDLSTKTYTKRLTQLERDFLHFLKGNKARFLPVEV